MNSETRQQLVIRYAQELVKLHQERLALLEEEESKERDRDLNLLEIDMSYRGLFLAQLILEEIE